VTRRSSLCLNLIVRNEAAIIDRLVNSVSPYISSYVVCDTGSTDDTVSRIRNAFGVRGIPGQVHCIPFVDFGQARNEALWLGRACDAVFDYFLLADADMELIVEDPKFPASLEAPAYMLRQCGAMCSYYNIRLLRRDVLAAYVGETHEYLRVECEVRKLQGAGFIDHACGANRTNKAARDLALLRQALTKNPSDARAMFYLAQTYSDLGRYQEAALWYEARLAAGGFPEERWYARYQLALCTGRLGDNEGFVNGCLDAFQERPWRVEPLRSLARYYRQIGQDGLATQYSDQAKRIPYPLDDILFVEEIMDQENVI